MHSFPACQQPDSGKRQKILIILHQENSTPGRLGAMLVERGYALDIRRPPLGHPLPHTLEAHAGAVMFGGPMSANDDAEYVNREIDWIDVPLRENKPFFGICLGAQMMVRHLGGEVRGHDQGLVEVGYYPIKATEQGREIMEWPSMIYQWHREGFSLPDGAVRLVTGDTYENQAIRYGDNAWGVQFHAELTTWMMNRWTVKGAARMQLPGAQQRHEHFEGRQLYDQQVRRWLEGFIDIWLQGPSTNKTITTASDSLTA